jgi:hypothetical protein
MLRFVRWGACRLPKVILLCVKWLIPSTTLLSTTKQFLPLPLGSTPLHAAAARKQSAVAIAILEHYVSSSPAFSCLPPLPSLTKKLPLSLFPPPHRLAPC